MSEKRSWDITPARRPARTAPQRPAADVVLVGRVAPRGARGSHESLRKRRRRGRRRVLAACVVLFLLLVGGAFYLLWRPYMRVHTISESGYNSSTATNAARAAILGTYHGIVPRDSIIFLPKQAIMNAVLESDANIAAVSVSRTGFSTIELKLIPRAQAYVWCGSTEPPAEMVSDAIASTTGAAPCYQADAAGTLFAPATGTSPGSAGGELEVYGPLATTAPAVLGSTIADASAIPGALRFARALDSLGAQSESLQVRGDEADVFLVGGTRVTYVLGDEQAAIEAAAAAFPTLTLNDGSIDYIDLRFDGKVYVKKVDD